MIAMPTAGIDIGGTDVKAGLVSPDGRVLEVVTAPTPRELGPLVETLRSLVVSLGRSSSLDAVGVGIPGIRSAKTGRIESSPNLPCLNGVVLETRLAEAIELPVVGRNDAEMHAWGEFSEGAGAGTRDMVCLTLGTGVGSGLVLKGELYSGSRGYAPEAGHLVVQDDGLPCACGSRGCLETLASATGIVALARRRFAEAPPEPLPDPLTSEELHRRAAGGHVRAREVFAEAGRFLGIACTDLIHLLNPEAIVIGGGVARAGAVILEPAVREARARAFRAAFEACRIVPARLGNEAGVVGAALLARRIADRG